jgi:hypothetical protein
MALPFLDAMVPAMATARDGASPVLRFGTVYVPNGMIMKNFWPATEGAGFEITPILRPLEAFRSQMLVLGGLANREADPRAREGGGDHSRSGTSFLTGAHAKHTDGPDMGAGTSMDQVIAKQMAQQTQLQSLELTVGSNEWIGACEPGYACPYTRTICWSTPTTPLPTENDPRVVFERLFGDIGTTDAAVRLARMKRNRSILDALRGDLARFQSALGAGDRARLDEYLSAVRDVERRIQVAEAQADRELPLLEQPAGGIPPKFDEHAKLLLDLLVLALQSDLTRVFTFMMGYEGSDRSYPEIGVADGHHPLTHNMEPEPVEKVTRINTFHAQMFAYFVEKLHAAREGEGTLLDQSILMFAAGISNGNTHSHLDVPVVLVGGGNGQLKGGRYVRYPDIPVANLHLSILDRFGIAMDQFGDSTGRLSGVFS